MGMGQLLGPMGIPMQSPNDREDKWGLGMGMQRVSGFSSGLNWASQAILTLSSWAWSFS